MTKERDRLQDLVGGPKSSESEPIRFSRSRPPHPLPSPKEWARMGPPRPLPPGPPIWLLVVAIVGAAAAIAGILWFGLTYEEPRLPG